MGLSNNGSGPTTAAIKMVAVTPYLKIEQSHHNVTTRVLLSCASNRITLQAGIVTTPELSREKQSSLARNYMETDTGEILIAQGSSAVGSVLWLRRTLNDADLLSILKTKQLGIWTENGGPMRWGATIELRTTREKIIYFRNNCLRGAA